MGFLTSGSLLEANKRFVGQQRTIRLMVAARRPSRNCILDALSLVSRHGFPGRWVQGPKVVMYLSPPLEDYERPLL